MSTKTISGSVHNTDGSVTPFTGTIVFFDPPVIQSVTVTPSTGAAGTPRTIQITATDPNGLVLTYACSVDGVALTQTLTPGEFIWNG